MKNEIIIPTEETVISVKESTRFILDLSDVQKAVVHLKFETPEVEAEIIALYKLDTTQKLDLTTIAHHTSPRTKCMTEVRGVLLGGSTSNYVGKIIIEKTAQQTVSYLDDKVLSIGEGTKNSSQPILQIDADDVKASHGATTGNVDPEQLYYLQSRGLPYSEAQELLVRGFFEEVIAQTEDEVIKEIIWSKLKL